VCQCRFVVKADVPVAVFINGMEAELVELENLFTANIEAVEFLAYGRAFYYTPSERSPDIPPAFLLEITMKNGRTVDKGSSLGSSPVTPQGFL
jgi:hypothetical protein